jgi:hypothetical protein
MDGRPPVAIQVLESPLGKQQVMTLFGHDPSPNKMMMKAEWCT